MKTSAFGQKRKVVLGKNIVSYLKTGIAQKKHLCHADGPSYNDHSGDNHDKAVP